MEDSIDKWMVVVGGGIAGIVASHLLSKAGHQVVLVENSHNLGGLLTSKYLEGHFFDHGTHILKKTGIAELDNFLFDKLDYIDLPILKVGSYYKGLYDKNGFLSDQSLSQNIKQICLSDLLSCDLPADTKFDNLEQQLIATYGAGYYNHLLKGVIFKYFGEVPVDLAPNSHLLFGLSRLIVADGESSRKLKENPLIDSKIAYASFEEGIGQLGNLYPAHGGAGSWIKLLEDKLIDQNIPIYKSTDIQIGYEHNKVQYVVLGGQRFAIDKLYWTAPPIILAKKMNLNLGSILPPKRLTSTVVDLTIHGNYNTDLYYIQVFDPSLKTFRVTLYDNYNHVENEAKRISMEFLSSSGNFDHLDDQAIAELISMGIVDKNVNIEILNRYEIPGGFPIPTNEFISSSRQINKALENFENLVMFGKSSGKSWFMNEVMVDIYKQLS